VSGTSGSSGTNGSNGPDGASSTYNPQSYDGSSNVCFIGAGISMGGYAFWRTKAVGYAGSLTASFATVGGGIYTTASGYASTVQGGFSSCVTNSYASVGGGLQTCATGEYGVVLGGQQALATGIASASVGGHQGQALAGYTQILGSNVQSSTGYASCAYYISKDAGSFRINHPDPEKMYTHLLYHSFVESPTAGDNIYRYEIQTCNGQASLELPSYYKFLNKNDQVWVTPVNHFGNAYGIVDQTQSCVSFCSDVDGKYMALIIGTRKDPQSQGYWNGVERIKNTVTHSTDIGLT
jgi:hypothetical protein